jgi:transposase
VIDVALLSVIRRWHLRDGISIREIARRTLLSRNTIAKYLTNGETNAHYPQRKSLTRLDPYAAELSSWLRSNQQRSRKQRRTAKQMHADLLMKGYTGSYGRVAAFARQWRRAEQERLQTAGRGTFVPLVFAPGEAFQFDWSEDFAQIGGERVKLQIAHFKLSHSRAFFLRAYPLQTHEMLFDAHHHAFTAFGGIPRRGIYDNMKTAVDKVRRGKVRDVNARFATMVSHYLFEAQFCNPASGWEKGQIEKNVQDARHRIWPTVPAVATLDALNIWLQDRCLALWQEFTHPTWRDRTVFSVWQDEQPLLMPMPAPFDGFVEQTKRVTPTCLVNVERNRYSVPASYANRPISVRLYADRVVMVAEGQRIAEHVRRINRSHDGGHTFYDWHHYLSVLQRKPGALRNGAPFAELPEGFGRLQAILLRRPGGDREMVEILALVLQYDEQAVLTAVELALDAKAPSKPHVLNLLARLVGEVPPAPVAAPPALALQIEPIADVARYDGLRGTRHVA